MPRGDRAPVASAARTSAPVRVSARNVCVLSDEHARQRRLASSAGTRAGPRFADRVSDGWYQPARTPQPSDCQMDASGRAWIADFERAAPIELDAARGRAHPADEGLVHREAAQTERAQRIAGRPSMSGRQHARGRLRRAFARSTRVDDVAPTAPRCRELVRNRAADNACADDDDFWRVFHWPSVYQYADFRLWILDSGPHRQSMPHASSCTIEYAGTRYSGWQIQQNARTVQGEIDRAVREVSGRKGFELYGSGRTDAGVHALAQVAHLDLATSLAPAALRRRLNDELPADIVILDAVAGAAPLSCAPRRGRAELPVSDRAPQNGVCEAVRLVGEGRPRCGAHAPRPPKRSQESTTFSRSRTTIRS